MKRVHHCCLCGREIATGDDLACGGCALEIESRFDEIDHGQRLARAIRSDR